MDEPKAPDPLQDLGARIDKAYGNRKSALGKPREATSGSNNAMAMGLRIGLELVVGVVAGVGIGFVADHFLGSKPWGVLGGFLLGVAAGMVNVYRAVTGIGMAVGYRQDGPRAPRGDSDDWDEE